MKAAESSATEPPPQESEVGITAIDYSVPQNEKDKLYVEMLYTIANTVSKSILRVLTIKVKKKNIKASPRQLILYLPGALTLPEYTGTRQTRN